MWKQAIPYLIIVVVATGGYKMWEREMKARGRAELELEQHAAKLEEAEAQHAADSLTLTTLTAKLAVQDEARLADAERYRALERDVANLQPRIDTMLAEVPDVLRDEVLALVEDLQAVSAACSLALVSCEDQLATTQEALALSEGMLIRERLSHRSSRDALVTAVNLSEKRWHVGLTLSYAVTYNLFAEWNEDRVAVNRWASGPSVGVGVTYTF